MVPVSREMLRRRGRAGPPLGPVMAASVGLFVASLAVPAMLTGGAAYPSPLQSTSAVSAYVSKHATALSASGLFLLASSVPLAVYAAAAAAQMRRVGVQAAGPVIALAGGVLASAALALSGLMQWTLAQADAEASLGLLVALRDLAFAAGGPWHTVGLGLLVAGVAVPALFYRLLPRWLGIGGVGIAVVCELTTFALLVDWAAYLIPVGRFPALLRLLTAGLLLPVTHRREVPA